MIHAPGFVLSNRFSQLNRKGSTMKNERIMQIADLLRTTDEKQGKSHLASIVKPSGSTTSEVHYCCMGLMCEVVPNISTYVPDLDAYLDNTLGEYQDAGEVDSEATIESIQVEEGELTISYDNATDMPPGALHVWLGLTDDADEYNGHTLYLDAPVEYRAPTPGEYRSLGSTGLDAFNDIWGLTFPQIGDLIAYFGLSPVMVQA